MQAARKLGEKSATVRVRQVDLLAVKEVIEAARKSYTALFAEDAPVLTLDSSSFLPPPPTDNEEVAYRLVALGVCLASARCLLGGLNRTTQAALM